MNIISDYLEFQLQVVGRGRKVLMSDKAEMPYMTAVLLELQRTATVGMCFCVMLTAC